MYIFVKQPIIIADLLNGFSYEKKKCSPELVVSWTLIFKYGQALKQ